MFDIPNELVLQRTMIRFQGKSQTDYLTFDGDVANHAEIDKTLS